MKTNLLICFLCVVALSSCGGGNSTSSKSKSSLSSNSSNNSISSLFATSNSSSSVEIGTASSNSSSIISSSSISSSAANSSSLSSNGINLLNNAGFEDSLTNWTDWGGLVVDTINPHTGAKSLTISLADGGGAQEVVYSGQVDLIVGAWARVSVDGESAYFGVDCLDENGIRISGGHTSVGPVTSLNWTYIQAAVVLVPGTAKLSVFVYHNPGNGAIFFDDLMLYPGVIETTSSSSSSSSSENSSSANSSLTVSSSDNSSLESSSITNSSLASSVATTSSSSVNSINSSSALSSNMSSASMSSSDSSSSSVIVLISSSSSSVVSSSSISSSIASSNSSMSSSSSMSSIVASSSSSSSSPNLLSNSGFENSLTDWTDWGGLVAETTDVHSGTGALTITLSDGGGAQEIAYSGQTNLTVGAWAKVSVTGEEAYFGVDCLDTNGLRIPGGHTSVGPVTSLTWSYMEALVTIVPGTVKLNIFVYHNPGPGSIFFDDITLY